MDVKSKSQSENAKLPSVLTAVYKDCLKMNQLNPIGHKLCNEALAEVPR
jgi:hypothetical protein